MVCALVATAVNAHAKQQDACDIVGIDPQSVRRWRRDLAHGDRRTTPKKALPNQLTAAEVIAILALVNAPAYRNLTPRQLVPLLAGKGQYLASESTIYRLLHAAGQLTHRSKAGAPHKRHRPTEHVATGPNQVWSWDITYLRCPVRGRFFYLYVVLDVWSRKIVGSAIHDCESSEHAAALISAAYASEKLVGRPLVLHADNGGPMKGGTLQATLLVLGITSSFSRPSVSNDNPYSESAFRTVKYCPLYPSGGLFISVEAARKWMVTFTAWYNHEHLHSGIRFVTPAERHDGRDVAILERRTATYQAARKRHPERWSGPLRNWERIAEVTLNPTPVVTVTPAA
jgi:putative transposase